MEMNCTCPACLSALFRVTAVPELSNTDCLPGKGGRSPIGLDNGFSDASGIQLQVPAAVARDASIDQRIGADTPDQPRPGLTGRTRRHHEPRDHHESDTDPWGDDCYFPCRRHVTLLYHFHITELNRLWIPLGLNLDEGLFQFCEISGSNALGRPPAHDLGSAPTWIPSPVPWPVCGFAVFRCVITFSGPKFARLGL